MTTEIYSGFDRWSFAPMSSFNLSVKANPSFYAKSTVPRTDYVATPSIKHLSTHFVKRRTPRGLAVAQAVSQEDMLSAEKRWNSQIKEGKVRNITTKGAASLMSDGWMLLDVRPPSEIEKAAVVDAVEVPVFLPDDSLDVGSLLKQMSAFGMGGWWLGGTHMEPNKDFLTEVQQQIPKDAKVIVACQKGLRSLAACEQLSRAGYQTLAWVNGGFDTAKPGEIPSKDNQDLRLAGIGGVSEMLGWTQVQQEGKKGLGDRVENILKIAGLIVAADLLVLAYEQIKYMTSQ